jgi:predicted RNA methylase
LALAAKLDELHQLIYRRGGIRPTNAAVEELSKLLFLRLWATREPDWPVHGEITLQAIFRRPSVLVDLVLTVKRAFSQSLTRPGLMSSTHIAEPQPIWPVDEPFRLINHDVLVAAIELVESVAGGGSSLVGDPLGTAFDALLSGRYSHTGGLGTYLTPSSVARAIADTALHFVEPDKLKEGGQYWMADPYCGTGRFLVAFAEATQAHQGMRRVGMGTRVLGADQASSSVAKARINLMLYGVNNPSVWVVDDSVTDVAVDGYSGKIPCVLTNPPFGEGKYDSPRGLVYAARFMPLLARRARIDPALACLARSASLVAPGGVLGIILPDGLIEGAAFSQFLEDPNSQFPEGMSVVASISLPTATFSLSGTVAKTTAIFIQRRGLPAKVITARARHVGFVRSRGKAAPDPGGSDLPRIVDEVADILADAKAGRERAPGSYASGLVSLGSAFDGRGSSRRLTAPPREEPRIGSHCQLSELIEDLRPRRAALAEAMPFLSILHVDEMGLARWDEAERHKPVTPGLLAEGGCLVVSLLNPSKLRATVVPMDYERVACSAEFGVFSTNVDPYAIVGLLYREEVKLQLRPLGRGTSSSRRRISPKDVLSLTVPILGASELAALAKTVRRSLADVRAARLALQQAYGA